MDQLVPVNLPTYFYSDDLQLWSIKKELFKIIVIWKEYSWRYIQTFYDSLPYLRVLNNKRVSFATANAPGTNHENAHHKYLLFQEHLSLFYGATAPIGPGPPQYRISTIQLGHAALGRTPLSEYSVQCRDLYLRLTRQKYPCPRWDSKLQS